MIPQRSFSERPVEVADRLLLLGNQNCLVGLGQQSDVTYVAKREIVCVCQR